MAEPLLETDRVSSLNPALYFPFIATFDDGRDLSAKDLADLFHTLRGGISFFFREALGEEAASRLEAAGLLNDFVLVTEIDIGSVTFRGAVGAGLIFLAGATFSPAWEESVPGKYVIHQTTRAIDAAYAAGVDFARQGAEAIAHQMTTASEHFYPTRGFRIESAEIVDGTMRIRLARQPRLPRSGGDFTL